MPPHTGPIGETALTLCCGAFGAFAFWLLGLPAAFLTGPAAFVTVAALAGAPVSVPVVLRTFCFVLIGIGIGSGISAETLQAAAAWPISLVVLALVQWISIAAGARMLSRRFSYPRFEAILSAVPGLLSYIVALAIDRGADAARVSLAQSIRILFLALLVPIALKISGIEISGQADATGTMPTAFLIPLAGLAWAGGSALARLGMPAAHILAGVMIAAAANLSGLAEGGVPGWLSVSAFVMIGSLIGSRFRGRSLHDMRDDFRAGIAITASAALFALAGAVSVAWLLNMELGPLLIAFAPGGLEVMIALSVQLDADPAMIAAHHVARLLILMAMVPFLLRAIPERER